MSSKTFCARDCKNLSARVTAVLLHLGFPANYKGYEYLRCAIMEAYCHPESALFVTKALYPRVAKLCGSGSAQNVARCCRHAIEYASNTGRLGKYYTPSKSAPYPPSALLISGIADYLHSTDN